jgi:hypothetical protein
VRTVRRMDESKPAVSPQACIVYRPESPPPRLPTPSHETARSEDWRDATDRTGGSRCRSSARNRRMRRPPMNPAWRCEASADPLPSGAVRQGTWKSLSGSADHDTMSVAGPPVSCAPPHRTAQLLPLFLLRGAGAPHKAIKADPSCRPVRVSGSHQATCA